MQIDYKVFGGKILRLDVDIDDEIIKSIKITGDFFIYPEEKIIDIENLLTGIKVGEVIDKLDFFINKEKLHIIGFTSDDLFEAIQKYKSM